MRADKRSIMTGYYPVRDIETIKDFVDFSTTNFKKRVAYMYKEKRKAPFTKLTYGAFRKQMNALGTALLNMGLQGSNIAVIGENSYQYVLSYFTVTCGVGTIVPIDRYLEIEEMEHLITRADVKLVFTDAKNIEKLKPLVDRVESLETIICLDNCITDEEDHFMNLDDAIEYGAGLLKDGDMSYVEAVVKADDVATILFTSGTTGLAKGVMLTHGNFAANVMNMSKIFHIPPKGRVLSVLPMHHAYEMTCSIMTTFYQGQTIVICEGLRYLMDNFREAKCCVFLGVPLIFEKMHKKIFREAAKTGDLEKLQKGIDISKLFGLKKSKSITDRMFKSIKHTFGKDLYCLIAGGAPIEAQVIEDFQAMGIPIIQGYGMTENGPLITVNPVNKPKADSAGIALPGTDIRIINSDDEGNGEILIKGPSVMKGYYKDEENTNKTIIDGWLHTGDYGHLDGKGYLYVTGRKKNVIVTKNGKNIFPEEIEFYLLLEDEIKEVMVYGKNGGADGDLICTAIVVPDFKLLESQGITEKDAIFKKLDEIVESVNEKVPVYKRVKRIEVREKEFIRTTTQKIKRFEQENYEYSFDEDLK